VRACVRVCLCVPVLRRVVYCIARIQLHVLAGTRGYGLDLWPWTGLMSRGSLSMRFLYTRFCSPPFCLASHLPTYLPACLPTYLPTYLPNLLFYSPAYLLICLPAYLPI
jgi:hypothetical protein